MSIQGHILALLLIISSAAIAQQRSWNIYDSTNIGIKHFMPTHVSGDSLYGTLDSYPFTIPVNSIERITIQRGNYLLQGTMVGASLGLVVGFMVDMTTIISEKTLQAVHIIPHTDRDHNGALICGVGGAVLGGLIGIAIPEQDVITLTGSTATVRIDRLNTLLQQRNN